MQVSKPESIKVLLDTLRVNFPGKVSYNADTNVAYLGDNTKVFVTWDNVISWLKDSIQYHGKNPS